MKKWLPAAALLFTLSGAFGQQPSPTPATAPTTYGPVPIPWTDVWVVKFPVLSPGVDYHINHYDQWKGDVSRAFDQATKGISAAVQALPPASLWAVIMDIDDTILDHSLFQKMCEESGNKFSLELWRGWVESKKAGLVPGAKEFMEAVNKRGGKVVLISNIKDYEELPVRERLAELGIMEGSHYAYLLAQALGSQSAKPERQRVVQALTRLTDKADDAAAVVTVLGSVGDQKTDEMEGIPFYRIPQGSAAYGMYGVPAVGEPPPPREAGEK